MICHNLLKICFDFWPLAASLCGGVIVSNDVTIVDATSLTDYLLNETWN